VEVAARALEVLEAAVSVAAELEGIGEGSY
jgi:hypothetical protein